MAFLMEDVLLYQDTCLLSDLEVCSHFLLEGAAVPEEETTCSKCDSNWGMRLQEAVEKSVDNYTTPYPCMSVDGNQAHIVPYMYQRCPHCAEPKIQHIAKLVTDLAKALVGSNVLEVQVDSGARTPFNFDARMFISAMAAAYPEMYKTTMQNWADKTQASDICGEVINFITPVKALHFNKSCNLDCSDNGQSNLNRLAVEAFDNEMVHGSKPKVWVTIVRTNRVKKDLARSRGAAKEKTGEEVTEANSSQLDTVDEGVLVAKSSEPSGSGSKKTALKKTKPRENDSEVTDTPAREEESAEQCVLSGNAAKQIRPTLPLSVCYSNTRPQYARYFINLGMGKIRELCVLSRTLDFRNSVASAESLKPLPKWIPRKFIQVNSETLLKRIRIVLKDTQPEVPIFNSVSGNQNVQNQPPSGLSPHSTVFDPMPNRGGNHLQARQSRNRGPRIGKGRGRGYQSNQGQQGYQNYQYDQHSGNRNNSHFRGRGTHRGRYNQWKNHFSGGASTGQVYDPSPVQATPSVPTPGAPVSNSNPTIGPNLTSGGSLLARYLSKDSITKALNDRQRIRRTAGSSVKCASTTCATPLITGPGAKYCTECGSNQDSLEMQHYKEEIQKINQQ